MLLTCPECRMECTFDEQSAETATCPGCGVLLYSRSGDSGHPRSAAPFPAFPAAGELECTQEWKASINDLLPSPEQLPIRLGRYELTKLLGEGSFAQVYLAFDAQLGRQVALKLPRKSRFASREHLERFVDEARTVAQLEHPGIVRVYDISWLNKDACFLAMEYCPDGSLSQVIKSNQQSVTPQHTAEIVADVAEALHFAHLKGYVHRDVKPSNVLFGSNGRARVVDFGLALPDGQQFERAGEIAGTLAYMSPEQLRGEAHRLDGRSDVWSLGVVFYELLAKRRPFLGERRQLADEILHRFPKPIRQIDDSVPKALEEICLKCLSKEVTDRYSTCADLASDLRRWLQTEAAPLKQPTTADSSRRPVTKLWVRVTIVLLLLMAIVPLAFVLASISGRKSGHLSAITPWNFDGKLTPRRPYTLLERPPRELYWRTLGDHRWDYDFQRQDVVIDSPEFGLLSLGETTAKSFKLEVELVRNSETGSAGVFWRGRIERETGKPPEWRVLAVFLQFMNTTGDEAFRLHLSEFTFPTIGPEPRLPYRMGLNSRPISFVVGAPHKLELEFSSGKLVKVLWNHQQLPELLSRLPQNVEFTSIGTFGLYNELGVTRFRDARFTLLEKER